jgi:hypothetical protein
MVLRVAAGKLASAGCALLLLGVLASAQTDNPPSKLAPQELGSAAPHKTKTKSKKTRKSARRTRGQQKIDPKRALEIQEALIREHYLDGKPSGVWNDATQRAMQRYQADNNWQSKTTPDARALIKLGLGPDHDHLLNPESAMTNQPHAADGGAASTPNATPDPDKQ